MTTLVDLETAKSHLNLMGSSDDGVVARYVDAAQSWLESKLGYIISERYSDRPVPSSLYQAALLMTAHFYANREASVVGVTVAELPLGVWDTVTDFRDWSWGEPDDE